MTNDVGVQWELPRGVGVQWELPGLGRAETRVTPPSGRRFTFEESTLFLKDPRADGSARGGPRLPCPGDCTATGKPPRANRRRIKELRVSPLWTRPAYPSGYTAVV
jgi:hypothetical protein